MIGLVLEWRLSVNGLYGSSSVETLRSVPRSSLVPRSLTGLFTCIDVGLAYDWSLIGNPFYDGPLGEELDVVCTGLVVVDWIGALALCRGLLLAVAYETDRGWAWAR